MPTHQGLAAGLADQNFRSKAYGADSAGNLRFSYSLEGCVPHTPRVPVLEFAWSSSLPCAGYYLVKLQKGPFFFFGVGGGGCSFLELSSALYYTSNTHLFGSVYPHLTVQGSSWNLPPTLNPISQTLNLNPKPTLSPERNGPYVGSPPSYDGAPPVAVGAPVAVQPPVVKGEACNFWA